MENLEIWTLLISGLAILMAALSLILSNNSNNRSTKIQEMQTRPWLIATVVKNKETGRYYDIIEENGYIDWNFQIEIENKGTTPANNIKLPNTANLKDTKSINENLFVEIPNIVLGQGQKYSYTFSIGGKPKKVEEKELMVKRYKKNDGGLIFKFKVKYKGLFNQNTIYSTKTTFDIQSDKVSYLDDSEFI